MYLEAEGKIYRQRAGGRVRTVLEAAAEKLTQQQ